MCGIAGAAGGGIPVDRALDVLGHRGPDASGTALFGQASLGHRRLSIIDLSDGGRQPMTSADGRYTLVFNGEIYNYRELRSSLPKHPFRTATDSEVLLAAWTHWGERCLDRLIGMFAFAVWDDVERRLTLVRDRFGVKPLYWAERDGVVLFASEIKALHALGVPRRPDEVAWATYLATGRHDHGPRTFWAGVQSLPPGHVLRVEGAHRTTRSWYDLADRVPGLDDRSWDVVAEEYAALLRESVELRFRADVPVGVNVSGGVDSSTLLAAVHAVQGDDSDVTAFTFTTGDPAYDELPWVEELLEATKHDHVECRLTAADVPALAARVAAAQDEPYGGIPTLAYARVFEEARERGVIVLLDGQGMDEQWAGYDYYRSVGGETSTVQGVSQSPLRPDCLDSDFASLAEPAPELPPIDDLRRLQYRDIRYTKLQRALRFNDRISMMSSTELREPFLDHRLVELAFAQPAHRKLSDSVGKVGLRRLVGDVLPGKVVEAPKRPLQTPQREWLQGPLLDWLRAVVDVALERSPAWFDAEAIRGELDRFSREGASSTYHLWQWASAGQMHEASAT